MASMVPGPPLSSSSSLRMQAMDSLDDHSPINVFAVVSNIYAFYLKKLFVIIACCFGIILLPFLCVLMVVFAPVVFCLMIILAIFALVLSLYPNVILAPVEYCFGNIVDPGHTAQPQYSYDIESGRRVLMMATIRTQAGRIVVNAGTRTTSTNATQAPLLPQQACYKSFTYRMDMKKELLGSGDECVVCLETFKEQDECAMLKCRHLYHPECIDKWLATANKKRCPICRQHA